MEKPKEKTPEQIFGEKISQTENKPNSKPTKSSWVKDQENQKNNSEETKKYFQEILSRTPKEKLENKEISFELPSLNDIMGLKSDAKKVEDTFKGINTTSKNLQQTTANEIIQYQQTIGSLKAELEECKHKMESMRPEIEQYQNVINLLRAEIAQYENEKSLNMPSEIVQYQHLIQALRAEISEYKRKMESMRPEIEQYDHIINSLKSEIYQYKHDKPLVASNEIGQFQILINSLRSELAEYKNKVELLSSERNQQNSIEALRAELAEYRKGGSTQSTTKYENMIKSLNIEISRLKNNLDSMILK